MMLSPNQIKQLMAVASEAAQQAGEYIAAFDRDAVEVNTKVGGDSLASQVVTQVDLACEALILDKLKPSMEQFDIAFLGEESASSCPLDEHPRLSKPYFWCVDPLDGTLPFTENVPGYSVSIALVSHSGKPILGVVYDPVGKELYQGACSNNNQDLSSELCKQGAPWHPKVNIGREGQTSELSLFFDRSFTTLPIFTEVVEKMEVIAKQLGYHSLKVHHQAGSVMNALQSIIHAPACYFKFPKPQPGGGSLWDFSATAAIAQAAGSWVSDIQGAPLTLNTPDSLFMNRQGVIYASESSIAKEVMALFKSFD